MCHLGVSDAADRLGVSSAAGTDQTGIQDIENENLAGNSIDIADNSIKGVASDYASAINGANQTSALDMDNISNSSAENPLSSIGDKISEIISELLKFVLQIINMLMASLGQGKKSADGTAGIAPADGGAALPEAGNLPVGTGTDSIDTPTVPSAGETTGGSDTTDVPVDSAPVDVPGQSTPVNVPTTDPVDNTADNPVDNQANSPDDNPTADNPVDTSVETPVDTPVDAPVETPVDIPSDTSSEPSSSDTATGVEPTETPADSEPAGVVDTPSATGTDDGQISGTNPGDGQPVSEVSGVDVPQTKGDYQLVWNDEFDYEGLPDPEKWNYDTDGNAWNWGNNEAQNYTANDPDNAYVKDGKLTITANKEPTDGKDYSSARLTTLGKGDWQNGRIEVSAKLPEGRGTWPAIWMLPSNNANGQWPDSGEIDIMENVGYDPDNVVATVHTGAYNHTLGTQKSSSLSLPDNSDQFHEYALEWDENEIRAYVDDQQYFTFKKESEDPQKWPFDQPFHLLLNLAVGGDWGGVQGIDDSIFPQSMQVDYVRVYQKYT